MLKDEDLVPYSSPRVNKIPQVWLLGRSSSCSEDLWEKEASCLPLHTPRAVVNRDWIIAVNTPVQTGSEQGHTAVAGSQQVCSPAGHPPPIPPAELCPFWDSFTLSSVLCTLPDLLSHLSSSTRNQQYLQLNILGLLPFYRSSGAQRPFLVLCYSVPLD